MRTYKVFNQTVDLHGQPYFREVGYVDVDVPASTARPDTAERAGREAIKVYADQIGDTFAVKYGSGFVVLRRPQTTLPERVTFSPDSYGTG